MSDRAALGYCWAASSFQASPSQEGRWTKDGATAHTVPHAVMACLLSLFPPGERAVKGVVSSQVGLSEAVVLSHLGSSSDQRVG